MKIRTAIFGVYAVASAVGFAALMAFVLREVRPRYVESMRRTLGETAALLSVLVEADLRDGQPPGQAWHEHQAEIEAVLGSLAVYVTDARGRVVFDSRGPAQGDYSGRPELVSYFAPWRGLSEDERTFVDGELRVTALVRHEGRVAGYVGVARPLSAVADGIWRARLRLIAGSSFVALVMTIAGWWIANRVSASLGRLTAYAQAVRDGRPAPLPRSRAKEVAELTRAFDEMRAALEGKSYVERYTQALAHALKAPLSGLRSAAELLQEEPPAAERARFLAHVRDESHRVQHIVDRMLQLAALESRRSPRQLDAVAVPQLLKEVAAGLQPAGAMRDITIAIEATPHLNVRAERFLLLQALNAIMENALDFSPTGGKVTLRAELAGAWVRFAVEDEGPGVPEFARERVFERFYSLPRPGSGRKSTGLGLSFVREIALRHGGRVRIENREGRSGACVLLEIPAVVGG